MQPAPRRCVRPGSASPATSRQTQRCRPLAGPYKAAASSAARNPASSLQRTPAPRARPPPARRTPAHVPPRAAATQQLARPATTAKMLCATRNAVSTAARPAAAAGLAPRAPRPRSRVVRRFREDERVQPDVTSMPPRPTTKLTTEQLEEVFNKEEGNVSPRMAEMRADMGSSATDLRTLQTFDGPAPETINGRLAMLGVLTGLIGEALTGQGLLEQTADHPVVVFASFVILSIASYVPLSKGYTRKEPFANTLGGFAWTPQAENWNGRLAMMGFAGMILTEAITGVNTLQAWGLQHWL